MNGMEIMLKSMGFDPQQIRDGLLQAQAKIEQRIQSVENQISVVQELCVNNHASLQRIELHLKTLPDSELRKILASLTAEEISSQVAEVMGHGRNSNGNNDN